MRIYTGIESRFCLGEIVLEGPVSTIDGLAWVQPIYDHELSMVVRQNHPLPSLSPFSRLYRPRSILGLQILREEYT